MKFLTGLFFALFLVLLFLGAPSIDEQGVYFGRPAIVAIAERWNARNDNDNQTQLALRNIEYKEKQLEMADKQAEREAWSQRFEMVVELLQLLLLLLALLTLTVLFVVWSLRRNKQKMLAQMYAQYLGLPGAEVVAQNGHWWVEHPNGTDMYEVPAKALIDGRL